MAVDYKQIDFILCEGKKGLAGEIAYSANILAYLTDRSEPDYESASERVIADKSRDLLRSL